MDLPDLDLVFVEGGTFVMGDDSSENDFEKPEHSVKVPSFYIGKYAVTQRLWKALVGTNNANFHGEKKPMEEVSWEDAQNFIVKLNRETGKSFRLPTEAEWEYAARGGQYSQKYLYAGSDKLKQVGWYFENSGGETHEVGLLMGNELGIHDMSGNIYEWCEDYFHDSYQNAPNDGSAWIDQPEQIPRHTLRGGGYFEDAVKCRSIHRIALWPARRNVFTGFRLVLSMQTES
ncbi:MAG: formylglycine-generating enzyme family protein [Lewinella sp.]|nr:formylglycine-generating enzyme family protein [Lewinella sp.]